MKIMKYAATAATVAGLWISGGYGLTDRKTCEEWASWCTATGKTALNGCSDGFAWFMEKVRDNRVPPADTAPQNDETAQILRRQSEELAGQRRMLDELQRVVMARMEEALKAQEERLAAQSKALVAAAVEGQQRKLDQQAKELEATRQQNSELSSRLARIEQELTKSADALKALQDTGSAPSKVELQLQELAGRLANLDKQAASQQETEELRKQLAAVRQELAEEKARREAEAAKAKEAQSAPTSQAAPCVPSSSSGGGCRLFPRLRR